MNCCKNPVAPKLQPAAPEQVKLQFRLAVEKANRCLRLARVIIDVDAVRLLQEMAADYLREAERLARDDD
jgi:hypothetical protein